MQKSIKFKHLFMVLILILSVAWCGATTILSTDGYTSIQVIGSNVQSTPRDNTIQASVDGHTLTIVFTQDIGQVTVEVTTLTGYSVYYTTVQTPNNVICYISDAGDYLVTMTLENGDEYFGRFRITD